MKRIVVLGSTGSIGTNALEIIRHSQDGFKLVGISGHRNYKLLMEQIEEFRPAYVSIGTKEGYDAIKAKFPEVNLYFQEEGLKTLAGIEEYDILLTAVSGAVGIEATVEGIKKGKRIALANKETMVAAGPYINRLLKENPEAHLIPVDSEHSAIFQSLCGGKKDEVRKIIITASGGTFRGKTLAELKDVTVDQALKHPNWSMGRKITIDSSTLVNKGLEVIEAHELFGVDYDDIEVVVHPQSIIHSMVEFKDRAVIAQLGAPDMKLPIQYAFTYPDRVANEVLEPLDFFRLNGLTFEKPDRKTFKGIDLAFRAGRTGKSMPAVLNAANEAAVDLFLRGKIKFLTIYEIIEKAMDRHTPVEIENVDIVKNVDKETRNWVYSEYER
ncbi:1-deoxy-D-xylulose-5-phosphate reductoisomerase [Fusobacterium sp.]|uniref:1-deoxy-D-xylulose-5-phosphate reductoisomerase n=1 Tax=Fusobacterium sp. TaxID=68766 RepID=UPI00396C9641